MHSKMNAGVILLAIVTLFVLWIGKALPKLIAMYGHGPFIISGYLLVAMGWIWALSMFTDARLVAILGEWRSNWLLWGLLLGPILFVVSGIGYAISARVGFNPPAEAEMASSFQGLTVVMLIILVVCLAVLEEWLFRGVVIDYLRSQSVILAVIGSATIFSLYHLSLFQLLPAFLLGFGLALIVVYFGAVWPAVAAHVLFNVIGVLLTMMGRYTGGSG